MRHIHLLLFVLLLASGCEERGSAHSEAPSGFMPKPMGWEPVADGLMTPDGLFYSEEGRFFAAFPGKPEHSTSHAKLEAGDILTHLYIYPESATRSFLVAYADYPTAYVQEAGWAAMIDRAVSGASSALGVDHFDEQTTLEINGQHAMRWRGRAKGVHFVSLVVLANNRLYQVSVVNDGNYPQEELYTQFLDKFHMVPPGQNVKQQDWWPEMMGADSAH
ncbi:MAG: hypothetical protein JNM31_09215 [Flavobacteriales bacterium]|nr:hypothetical protein [Flavobacteriales bacterium]